MIFMRKQKLLGIFLISTMLLCGCTKMEKDTSYDTDLYGTYKEEINATNTDYERKVTYTLNKDNTYITTHYEKNDGQILYDNSFNDKINSTKELNDGIIKIELNNGGSKYNIYKYKNLLGDLKIAEVPNGTKFDLFIPYDDSSLNAGLVLDKEGYYHGCSDYKNCTDDKKSFMKYKRKNNIIYLNGLGNHWQILFYIVNDGLFFPKYTKEK